VTAHRHRALRLAAAPLPVRRGETDVGRRSHAVS
jgi:hypothetical protein